MLILYGLILLLCKVSLLFSTNFRSDIHRRIPDCIPSCARQNVYILPFLTSLKTENDVFKFKLFILDEIENCSQQKSAFYFTMYLPPSRSWIRCCDLESCFMAIMPLHVDDLRTNVSLKGVFDELDQAEVYKTTEYAVDEASFLITSSVRLYMDYLVDEFKTSNITSTNLFFVYPVSIAVQDKSEIQSYFPNITIYPLHDFSSKHDSSLCDKQTSIQRTDLSCSLANTTGRPTSTTFINLRIFLGFGSLSKEHFQMIIKGITDLLSEPLLSQNLGSIIINGPKGTPLGLCFWFDVENCIDQLTAHESKDVFVPTSAISRDDIEFSPDILNYMRDEALKKRSPISTFVLVVTDFLSLEFLQNHFFFQRAMQKQQLGLTMAFVLDWNGLDEGTIDKYYGNVTDDVIVLQVFDDLSKVRRRIIEASQQIPNNNTSTTEYSNTISNSPTTATSSTKQTSPPTTTVSTSIFPLNEHGDDTVIALSLANWITLEQLNDLKAYLRKTVPECVSETHLIAIQWDPDSETQFCSNASCVHEQLSRLSLENLTSHIEDDTVPELNHLLNILTPERLDSIPTLFLITDFVSSDFVEEYDDAKAIFRTHLASVDFQVLLINDTTTNSQVMSSIPKKNIHNIQSFDELYKSKNYFCSKKNHLSHAQLAGIICGFFIILLIVLYIIYKLWNYVRHLKWQNKFLSLERCSLKDNDYLSSWSDHSQTSDKAVLSVHQLAFSRDPWEMSRQQICLGTEIGRGICGVVYRASLLGRAPCEYIHRSSFFAYQYENGAVAVKIQSNPSDERSRRQLLNEIEIMKVIRPHPNIANLLGCVTSYNPICLVIEYAGNGSLKEYMRGRKIEQYPNINDVEAKVASIKDVLSYLWQVCDGMSFIHDSGVIHRDLAARNILLEGKRNVLISDFGLAIWKEDCKRKNMSKRLPIKWTAPEALKEEQFMEPSDVWSFGVCAWEILSSGANPYEQVANSDMLSYLNSGTRLDRPITCDDHLWSLLMDCWKLDAASRPTFSQMKELLMARLDVLCQSYGYLDLNKVTLNE